MDIEQRERFDAELNAPIGGRDPAQPSALELQQEAEGFMAMQQMMSAG